MLPFPSKELLPGTRVQDLPFPKIAIWFPLSGSQPT